MKKSITLVMLASTIQFCIAQDSGVQGPVGNVLKNEKELTSSRNPNLQNFSQGACDSLMSTFAGGNNHRGNMFDITAINDVTIASVDAHPMANTNYAIYYKAGTFAGSENDSTVWTLVGQATGVVAQPFGTPTPLPIAINITIPAGQTYGWYVTSTDVLVAQNYTNGTAQGNVFASDANIQFLEGVGLEYPFSGAPFTPRVWNGWIHYCLGATGIENILGTVSAGIFPNPVSNSAVIS